MDSKFSGRANDIAPNLGLYSPIRNELESNHLRIPRIYSWGVSKKLSTKLIRENQAIAIENLKIKSMVQNKTLSKGVSDVSWGEFRRQLEYKAKWYGRTIVVADAHYASSQLCSACGYQHKAVKNLKLRKWTCPACQAKHDRDLNAAINLKKLIPA